MPFVRSLEPYSHVPCPRIHIVVAACASAFLLGGCVGYRPAPIDVDAMHARWTQRRLDDPALIRRMHAVFPSLGPNEAVPHTWDQADLLAAALLLNPDLDEARARLREALAAMTTAAAYPNPTIGLALERYTQAQADAHPWLWGLSTDIPIDTPLRRRLRRQSADAGVRAARLGYAEKIWSVRAALRDALVADRLAGRQRQLATRAATVAKQLQAAAQQRQDLGEDGPGPVLQASRALARARDETAKATQQAVAARAALARAIGVPTLALDGLHLQWQGLDAPAMPAAQSLDALRQQALLARTDLEHALVAYQQREIELHQQVRAQYPKVSLGPGYTYDHGLRTLTFGLSATLPVFDRNRGPIAEARARREAAAAHVRAVQADIGSQIDAAEARLAAALSALDAARAGAHAATRQRTQAEQAFRLGDIDRATLLTARMDAIGAAQAALDALGRTWQAHAALEDALRAPLDPGEARLPIRHAVPDTGAQP